MSAKERKILVKDVKTCPSRTKRLDVHKNVKHDVHDINIPGNIITPRRHTVSLNIL